jgi:hypothetical protein
MTKVGLDTISFFELREACDPHFGRLKWLFSRVFLVRH